MDRAKTRIPMLEREQVSPELAALYDVLLKQRGVVQRDAGVVGQRDQDRHIARRDRDALG